MNIFGGTNFKPPIVRAKRRALTTIKDILTVCGRVEGFSAAQLETVKGAPASFLGDIPVGAGDERLQHHREYKIKRQDRLSVQDVLYTDRGMAWTNGRLNQRYSIRRPSPSEVWMRPKARDVEKIHQGTIVQSQYSNTWGDWVSEHLLILSKHRDFVAPLLIPETLYRRSYVVRDLNLLGLDVLPVRAPILVENALILNKTNFQLYWSAHETEAIRNALNVDPPAPAPGSLLYLSREDVQSELDVVRKFPHAAVSQLVHERGGMVVRTGEMSYEQTINLAANAETVIADHGAALCNLLFWRPKRVIELVTDNWWNNCFLFLAKAVDVQEFVVLRSDHRTDDEIKRAIGSYLD